MYANFRRSTAARARERRGEEALRHARATVGAGITLRQPNIGARGKLFELTVPWAFLPLLRVICCLWVCADGYSRSSGASGISRQVTRGSLKILGDYCVVLRISRLGMEMDFYIVHLELRLVIY